MRNIRDNLTITTTTSSTPNSRLHHNRCHPTRSERVEAYRRRQLVRLKDIVYLDTILADPVSRVQGSNGVIYSASNMHASFSIGDLSHGLRDKYSSTYANIPYRFQENLPRRPPHLARTSLLSLPVKTIKNQYNNLENLQLGGVNLGI